MYQRNNCFLKHIELKKQQHHIEKNKYLHVRKTPIHTFIKKKQTHVL